MRAALTRDARARSKMWERELMDEEMDALLRAFEGTARVSCQHGMSIVSLICNVARTSEILEQARAPRRGRATAPRRKCSQIWSPARARWLPPRSSCAPHCCITESRWRPLAQAVRGVPARLRPGPALLGPGCARGRPGVPRAGPRRREREDDEPGRVEDQHLPHRQRRGRAARCARAAPPVLRAGALTRPGPHGVLPMHAPQFWDSVRYKRNACMPVFHCYLVRVSGLCTGAVCGGCMARGMHATDLCVWADKSMRAQSAHAELHCPANARCFRLAFVITASSSWVAVSCCSAARTAHAGHSASSRGCSHRKGRLCEPDRAGNPLLLDTALAERHTATNTTFDSSSAWPSYDVCHVAGLGNPNTSFCMRGVRNVRRALHRAPASHPAGPKLAAALGDHSAARPRRGPVATARASPRLGGRRPARVAAQPAAGQHVARVLLALAVRRPGRAA